ncbi:MAG TPA: ASKHA domain-containing protein [Terriglobales bacterium]|nr:ASKHA domain-containing protein [Terriglobales bacterium]
MNTADCQVTFQPIGKRVVVKAGTTLLDAGRLAGLLLSANCGGVGICGKCRVNVKGDGLLATTETEHSFLGESAIAIGDRLACEARVASSVVVEVTAETSGFGQKLQIEGPQKEVECDSGIQAVRTHVAPPSLDDARSDFRRLCDALQRETGQSNWTALPEAARQITDTSRKQNWRLSTYIEGSEVIGVSASDRPVLGLAVDLGCTKIAAYLVDLASGKQIAADGVPNPQIPYGEDLISRLVTASKSNADAQALATAVRASIRELATELCSRSAAEIHEITSCCIVGNTAMMHLLLALPVAQLLHAPFIASTDAALELRASDLDLQFAPAARVRILPSIGGFVGADHVAMILAHGIDSSEKITLGLDIGTNTEIVVHDPRTGSLLTTSVPSGPAFEGGHVRDAMRAATGAIDKVYSSAGTIHFHVIDDTPPVGICGSGIVDLIAELWHLGYINSRGHLQARDERVRKGHHGLEFVIVDGADSGIGRDVVLAQRDITEIQLAKAAIAAGIATLLDIANLPPDSVQEVVVAGAFGSNLNLRSAIGIGLLPAFPNATYLQIGNAAGTGATMALLSRNERAHACTIADRATRIELKKHEVFNRYLARATQF